MRGDEAGLGILVAVLLLISLAIQLGPGGASVIEMDLVVEEDGQVRLEYTLADTIFSKSINVMAYSVSASADLPVRIYFEGGEVDSFTSSRILGLFDHLKPKLQSYGFEEEVSLINRKDLSDMLDGPSSILIVASVISDPASIADPLLEWVMEGGVLISIGDAIPFEGPDGAISIRYEELEFMDGQGMEPSVVASAFAMQVVAPTYGMVVEDVLLQSGRVIGYQYEREVLLTSAALFELGGGRLVAMSGNLSLPILTSGEEAYANDIARIASGWALWMQGDPILDSVMVGTGQYRGNVTGPLPVGYDVVGVILDTEESLDLFERTTVPGST